MTGSPKHQLKRTCAITESTAGLRAKGKSRCTDAARTRVDNTALVCVRVRKAFRPSTLAATLGKRLGQVAGLVYHVARAPSLRTGPLVNSVRQALYRSARGAPYVLRADPCRTHHRWLACTTLQRCAGTALLVVGTTIRRGKVQASDRACLGWHFVLLSFEPGQACTMCAPGSYARDGLRCETCPMGFFSNTTGAAACTECPLNSGGGLFRCCC